jgi:cytochrome c
LDDCVTANRQIFFGFLYFVFCLQTTHAAISDQQALIVAKQNGCLGCHAVNKKIVGPSFESVAFKYKNDPNAKSFLKNKILKGGAGSWGIVPMPANAKLSDADLSLLASWILSGAPSTN